MGHFGEKWKFANSGEKRCRFKRLNLNFFLKKVRSTLLLWVKISPFEHCSTLIWFNMNHMMIMMLMNCFCGIVDWRTAFSLMSCRDHCQRSSPWQIPHTLRAGFEPAQNQSSGLVEWSCAVVITSTPRRLKWRINYFYLQLLLLFYIGFDFSCPNRTI